MESIYNFIESDDLTEDLRILAEICGLDTVKSLLSNCSGLTIYVPKLSRLDTFVIRYLELNKKKSNKLLALELGVSESFIRGAKKRQKELKKLKKKADNQ